MEKISKDKEFSIAYETLCTILDNPNISYLDICKTIKEQVKKSEISVINLVAAIVILLKVLLPQNFSGNILKEFKKFITDTVTRETENHHSITRKNSNRNHKCSDDYRDY